MKRTIAIVLAVLVLLSITVFTAGAKISPTPTPEWHITVDTEGNGTASVEPDYVIKYKGENVVLEAKDGDDSFEMWIIEGDYEIIEGDLYTRYLVIKPLSDIHAIAKFGHGGNNNNGKTSPKTGTTVLAITILLAALAAGVVVVLTTKKIRKNK